MTWTRLGCCPHQRRLCTPPRAISSFSLLAFGNDHSRRLAVVGQRRVYDRHVAVSAVFFFVCCSCAGATALHPRPSTSTLTTCATAANHRAKGDRFPTSKRRVLLKSSGPRGGFTGAGGPVVISTQFRLAGSQREARRGPCRFCTRMLVAQIPALVLVYQWVKATRAHGHTNCSSTRFMSTRIWTSEVQLALRIRLA
jgi:hypothetical protein